MGVGGGLGGVGWGWGRGGGQVDGETTTKCSILFEVYGAEILRE